MDCPNCKRHNADGLTYCDFCGTPLAAPSPSPHKRKTEAEAAPPPSAKRKTEIESPEPGEAGGFDPFAQPKGGFTPAARPGGAGSPGAAAAPKKLKTQFDAGDPFATPAPARPGAPEAPSAQGRRIVGWLVTFDGDPDGTSFIVREGRNGIGRDATNEIPLADDGMVSGTHAYLIWRAGRARIADHNSQNGTFLNEQDVLEQVEVKDGDVIRVGRTRFLVRLLDADKVASLWKPTLQG